jgi:hypothetical protein
MRTLSVIQNVSCLVKNLSAVQQNIRSLGLPSTLQGRVDGVGVYSRFWSNLPASNTKTIRNIGIFYIILDDGCVKVCRRWRWICSKWDDDTTPNNGWSVLFVMDLTLTLT